MKESVPRAFGVLLFTSSIFALFRVINSKFAEVPDRTLWPLVL